jgi:DNA-directed RNA polymerase specialized sigma24 family protein
MMVAVAVDEPDCLLDRWQGGERDDRALFLALREPMRRAAAGGIRRMTGERANADDVDDAVFLAFTELTRRDPAGISTLVGLAARMAWRRGQDIGRRINRAREHPDSELIEAGGGKWAGNGPVFSAGGAAPDPEEELLDAERFAERDHLFRLALGCIEQLPPGQAQVVEATVLRSEELTAWARRQGKSYQAAHKQRAKALEALIRCVTARRRHDEGSRRGPKGDGDGHG